MARDREIACESYVCEGNCSKGREGTFRKYCQTCNKYRPIPGGRPARPNLKHEKKEKGGYLSRYADFCGSFWQLHRLPNRTVGYAGTGCG